MDAVARTSANPLVDPARMCKATTRDGLPCRQPCKGDGDLCVAHDPESIARRRPAGRPSGPPIDLDALCQLDLSDPSNLKSFRSGMLTAMVRGELDATRATRAVEIAGSIYLAGKDDESSRTLTSLASILKRALASDPDAPRETTAPGGEGGNPG